MARYCSVRRLSVWWCLCLCVLCATVTEAATRKNVNVPPARDQVRGGKASGVSGGVLTIVGPALEGEYIPRGGTGGANIPVRGIHGGVTAGARTIASRAVSGLRGGIVGVVGTAAVVAALDGIGALIDEAGKPVKKIQETAPQDVFCYYFTERELGTECTSPASLQAKFASIFTQQMGPPYVYRPKEILYDKNNIATDVVIVYQNDVRTAPINARGACPGLVNSSGECVVDEVIVPLTDSDYTAIEDALSNVQNSTWLKDLLTATCEGSLSPGRCYDELTSLADQLKGPSSVKGPSSSTTSTYTRPDGTTGTTNTTTETNYTINYGPNYFDYSKTTTTTTSKDGEKPTTTTETESPEVTGEDPATEPESQTPSPCTTNCEGPAYEDQYKPTEETKESVIDNYLSRVEQAPIVNAATGFFDVSVSASCPTWQAPVDMSIMGASFHSELVFDHHCQPWFTGYRTAAMAVVMVLCAFGAFYIAMLD